MDGLILFILLLYSIAIAIFLIIKPRISLYILIFFCIFDAGFFSRWLGVSRNFARLPFFLAVILCAGLILRLFVNKSPVIKRADLIKATFMFFMLLIMESTISVLANKENFWLGMYELRYYFFLIVLCVGIYIYKPIIISEIKFVRFIILIGLIQIPFTALQNFSVMRLGVHLSSSALDMSSGTFVGYPPLVFLQCVAVSITFMYQLRKRRPILKVNNYFLMLFLIIPLVLSMSRSATGFVLIIIVVVFIRELFIQKKMLFSLKATGTLVLLLLIVTYSFYNFFWKVHFNVEQQLNSRYVFEYLFRDPTDYQIYLQGGDPVMGRGKSITESYRLISKSLDKCLIGLGSGSTSDAIFLGLSGRHYFKYGPEAGLGRTQYSKIIAEYGLFGLMLFISFFIYILRKSRQVKRKEHEDISYDIYVIIVLNIALLSFYCDLLHFYISILILAFSIAILQQKITNKKDSIKLAF